MIATEKNRLTYNDYAALTPPDSGGYQLIGGEIIQMGTPIPMHQRMLRRLMLSLTQFVEPRNLGEVFCAPLDCVFAPHETYQPDVFFISTANAAIIGEKIIEGAPDLVVEILSPSTAYYDLRHKKTVYEKFGVKEYWIVDGGARTVEVFFNSTSKFVLLAEATGGNGQVASRLLTGFEIDLTTLFASL